MTTSSNALAPPAAAGVCPVTGAVGGTEVAVGMPTAPDRFRSSRLPLLGSQDGPDPRIPGRRGMPFLGVAPQMMRDPFKVVQDTARRHGDVARIPMPGYDLVLVSHPELARDVLHDREGRFGGVPVPDAVLKVTGHGLPTLHGDAYKERRRMITPMFGKRFLAGLADDFVDEFSSRLRRWDRIAETGEEVDLQHELALVLLPAFLRNMYSIQIDDDLVEQLDRDLGEMLAAFASVFLTRRFPNPMPFAVRGQQSLPAAVARTARFTDAILSQRRSSDEVRNDLLQVLLDARTADDEPLRHRDLRADAIGLTVAGYDTVVASMAWMFSLLPTNPGAQARLVEEVDALGPGLPTADSQLNMPWARQCFDEAQRLQGHPFNPRQALVDTTVAGFSIPRGTLVGVCMTALHRDPRWWKHPDWYDPTHFDPEEVAERPNEAFIPFGSGAHICVGMAMAYQNAMLLTAMITQRYSVVPRQGWSPRHENGMAVRVKGGVPATLERR